jgi:hypothetical protein
MKTLREYIDLIDGKVSKSPLSEVNIEPNPNSTSGIVNSIMKKLFAPGATQSPFGPNPKGLVAEIDDEDNPKSKSLVDFTDSDKYDNFVAPDEDEAEDYKAGIKGHKKIKDSDVYGRDGFSDAAVGGLVGPN